MTSESETLSEEISGSSCWSPPSAESSGLGADGCGSGPSCKLFIYSLARTVTDADLAPLFAPFSPIYSCVAIGKKGTSRRFGFAKFRAQADAQRALEALRGTVLHGREVDLKFAVALEEPDPASGVQPKLRAKMRAQDLSPRIAAHRLSPGSPRLAAAVPSAAAAAVPSRPVLPMPLPLQPASSALSSSVLSGPASGAGQVPMHMEPGAVPAQLPDGTPAFHYLLTVPHGPGLSRDSITQVSWSFRPIHVNTSSDASGGEKSSVLFAVQQQAHGAQEALIQCGAAHGHVPFTAIAFIPLHGQAALQGTVPMAPQQAMPAPYAPPSAQSVARALLPEQQQDQDQPVVAPARAPTQHPQQQQQQHQSQMPSLQQQREAVTMRPLYAGPRPNIHPMHMVPVGYHQPAYPPPMGPAPSQPPCLGPGAVPMRPPPPPPPYHFLGPHPGGDWQPPEAAQPAAPPPGAYYPAPAAAPMLALPESLLSSDGPPAPKQLNPSASTFQPIRAGRAADGAPAPSRPQPQAQPGSGHPPVTMPPVIHNIFGQSESALAGRSFVPAWERTRLEHFHPEQPLVVAEAVEYESGTEDEGEAEPDPREVFAAVNSWNLNTCFVTRTLMRKLAPVEVLLKQTAVGDDPGSDAPSVLTGAVVRLLVDKTYKLRQVQETYVKPETGRLMLVLHDVSSPIPADHISNTCPLTEQQLTSGTQSEILELQAKLAFHGRRLFRHELAATTWRLQIAEHWQHEHGGKTCDELRLATAHLRAMLRDEDEIRWRRRGVIGLDLSQETAAIASAFHLPWNAAANWMSQHSPAGKLVPAQCPGRDPNSAKRSNSTGEYETRAMLGQQEVLGLQVGIHMAPSRAVCRSLERSIAEPQRHERYMASALEGKHPGQAFKAAPLARVSSEPHSRAATPPVHLTTGSAAAAAGAAAATAAAGSVGAGSGVGISGDTLCASLGAEVEQQSEEDLLLAEAAMYGAGDDNADWPPLPAFFSAASPIAARAAPPAASPTAANRRAVGARKADENCASPNRKAPAEAPAGKPPAASSKGKGLERANSGRIPAVRMR